MTKLEVPSDAREALARLGHRRIEERRKKLAEQRLKQQRGERELEALRPMAERIMEFASELAAAGLLSDLGRAGVEIYAKHGDRSSTSIAVAAPGIVVAKFTGGAFSAGVVARNVQELLAGVGAESIRAVAAAIDDGDVWRHVAARG